MNRSREGPGSSYWNRREISISKSKSKSTSVIKKTHTHRRPAFHRCGGDSGSGEWLGSFSAAPSPAPSTELPESVIGPPGAPDTHGGCHPPNLPRKALEATSAGMGAGCRPLGGRPFSGRRGRRWDPRPEPSRSLLSEPRCRASAAAVPAAPRRHPLGRDYGLRVEVTSLS